MEVIKVENVSKKYQLGAYGGRSFFDDVRSSFRKAFKKGDVDSENDFWALSNINFSLNDGDVLGIIGKNGAGKSTLLKLLSQITSPTTGQIKIKGRIASLLEVGTGFHPELTGRENIFLNGAILGMTKFEIKSKLDEIIAFSGIEHHIDTPVKRYSSGMKVRLGFAVAAHLEPEVLVVDEVLAVGDIEFQNKCIGKMKDVSESGRTILFVSHNMSSVRNLCTRGIVLSEGKLIIDSNIETAISHYLNLNTTGLIDQKFVRLPKVDSKNHIQSIEFLNTNNDSAVYEHIDEVVIRFNMQFNHYVPNCFLVVFIDDNNGNNLFINSTDEMTEDFFIRLKEGFYSIKMKIPSNIFKPGRYFVSFSLRNNSDTIFHKEVNVCTFSVIDNHTIKGMRNRYRSNALFAPKIDFNLTVK